jgi:hypothetical protein
MCDCNYDRPKVFKEIPRRARKRHQCCECQWLIEPGTAYHESRGLWNGEWRTYRTCGSCFVVANDLLDCYSFGDLAKCLDEDLGIGDRYRGSEARSAYAAMMRRRRQAERTLRREAAHA